MDNVDGVEEPPAIPTATKRALSSSATVTFNLTIDKLCWEEALPLGMAAGLLRAAAAKRSVGTMGKIEAEMDHISLTRV